MVTSGYKWLQVVTGGFNSTSGYKFTSGDPGLKANIRVYSSEYTLSLFIKCMCLS